MREELPYLKKEMCCKWSKNELESKETADCIYLSPEQNTYNQGKVHPRTSHEGPEGE
jgi:hypothetical protein